jgi:DNA repair photolyase
VGVSIPTIDDGVRAHFEPRAASIPERLAVLDAFRDAGVSTIAVVQPQLPGPVDALADALAARVGSVSLGVLRGEQNAEALFDVAEYRIARGEAWQDAQALALRDALAVRGIPTWTGELPP